MENGEWRIWNLEFGMRNEESQNDGFTKPDMGAMSSFKTQMAPMTTKPFGRGVCPYTPGCGGYAWVASSVT